jgi:uncharacterized protein involved in exopolysaccharide biosynthesis
MQIHPAEILKALWRDKWLVIGIGLTAALLSVAYALTRKPMFTSEALLTVADDDSSTLGALGGVLGQVSALTGVLGMPRMGGTSVEEVTAVLRSREFSVRFIRNHDLLPVLFPEREWPSRKAPAGPAPSGSKPPPVSAADESGPGPRLRVEDILARFDTLRSITVDRRTNFVSLSFKARDPQTAQRVTRAMIDDVNAELRARALVETRRAEEFLHAKIASAQYESIKNTAAALLESQLKREVLAESRSDFALRMLDPPSLPETRSYPKRTKIVIIGGFLGGVLAVFIVLLRRRHALTRSTPPVSSAGTGTGVA